MAEGKARVERDAWEGRDVIVERVASVVGRERVRTGEAATRWAAHGLAPRVVAAPPTDEAAAELLALASAEGWRVTLAGNGGGLDARHVPGQVDLVVATEALAGVESHEPADLVATVRAGTTLGALAGVLAPHRQWLPLDPPDRGDATVGAVFAQASAGPLREAHGTPRDHVLGLRLVTGDGRVLDLGGRVVKNAAGYDLVRLITGSRGTLGLITRLHLRLRPLPERDETLAWRAAEPGPLVDLAAWIREERLGVAAVEVVGGVEMGEGPGQGGVEVVKGPGGAVMRGAGEGAWTLLVRLQGNAEAVEAMRARLAEVVKGMAPMVDRVAETSQMEESVPEGDSRASSVTATKHEPWSTLSALEANAALCIRLADLPSRLGETLGAARELATDLPSATILAHAGAGIVRVCAAQGSPALAEPVRELRERLADRRGTVRLTRAPSSLIEHIDPEPAPSETVLRLTRGLQQTFDPAGILARRSSTP